MLDPTKLMLGNIVFDPAKQELLVVEEITRKYLTCRKFKLEPNKIVYYKQYEASKLEGLDIEKFGFENMKAPFIYPNYLLYRSGILHERQLDYFFRTGRTLILD